MTELTNKELEEGKKVLGSVIILLWVAGVLAWLGQIYFKWIPDWIPIIGKITYSSDTLSSIAIPALYVAALVGLYIRKGWAVPVSRAAIIVTMVIFFPVGTIFGAIVWKRINDPIAKRYLNYGEEKKDNIGKKEHGVPQKNDSDKRDQDLSQQDVSHVKNNDTTQS